MYIVLLLHTQNIITTTLDMETGHYLQSLSTLAMLCYIMWSSDRQENKNKNLDWLGS